MTTLTGRLLLAGDLVPGTLTIADGRIAKVERTIEAPSAGALPVIAPGFVDLHVHGFGGHDPLDALEGMARALAREGTTGFQPTLFPRDPEGLGEDVKRVAAAAHRSSSGARALGLHLEGPFLNPEAAGAIPRADLVAPSPGALAAILGPAMGDGRAVRTMTIAPELPGAGELVKELARSGVRASLGHSRATAAEAHKAARAGASGVTHLFNAMSGIHHRRMGLAGAALTSDAVAVEIIGDLAHVEREAVELALAARGPEGLCLVSDALQFAGTGCDVFHSHGREHVVRGGTAYYPPLEEGGALQLAGSACSQLAMVRGLVGAGVISLAEALTMASASPARALGLESEIGVLRAGARADVVLLRGEDLEVDAVYVGGLQVS